MKIHDEKLKSELLTRGLISEEQAQRAATDAAKSKSGLKDCLVRAGALKEEDLLMVEADVLGVTYLDLEQYLIDEEVVRMVPEKIARKHQVMPVFKIGQTLTVATSDPLNILAMDEVRAASKTEVEAVLSPREVIRRTIEQYYGVSGTTAEAVRSAEPSMPTRRKTDFQGGDAPVVAERAADEAPVVKLVNLLIMKAVEERASDIHIEPEEDAVRVRNRIDGALHESTTFPKKLQPAVASRIKIMAKLDIAESRKPQDGKIRLKAEGRDLDVRVSTFPTMHGENIVLRLLEPSKMVLGLPELGFEGETLKRFEAIIRKAYGMVLVTGPTGAGKTTTIYSALNTINSIEKNIITIEDPVEYQLPLVRQTQVNPKAGLTFASGLRSILRQDPDVILVGEIRDSETADTAVQAALTGHLVFSTVHTNDAAGAIARLMDMDVEPFLISSAVIGVLAQRLVRTLCQRCREPYKPDPELLAKLGATVSSGYFRAKGCASCRGTGYDSRVGIYEMMVADEAVRKLMVRRASSAELKACAQRSGMVTMRADGLAKAARGITTLEEVLKVTLEEE